MSKPEQSEQAAPPKAAGKKRSMVLIGGALAVVAAAVVVGVMGFPDQGAAHEDAPKPPQVILVGLPQIIVNLSASKGLRLLQVTATVELSAIDPAVAESAFGEALPRVQDLLIRQLSTLTNEEIDGAASKDFIKTRIKDELNGQLFKEPGFKVSNVFFTEFVLQ